MKKERGFTLIELLVVILIIAIIALISAPIVFNQIEKARVETFRDSIKGMMNAITYYQTENEILDGGTYQVGNDKLIHEGTELEVSGSVLGTGTIVIDDNNQSTIKIQYDRYCATGDVDHIEIEEKECN